nr:programmed cell death protein 2-like [Vanessa tameamea]
MAKSQSKVYLGYEEEIINERNKLQLNYTINKIGGLPNWPPLENIQFSTKCPLCNLHRLLVVQCYASLDDSVYHRTLYVFACINPSCWVQSESWTCVRSQMQDAPSKTSSVVVMPNAETNLSWCRGSDDWEENDNGDSSNGNVINIDNNGMQRNSDEEDESNSFELETVEQGLENLQIDSNNANMSPVQGAVGEVAAPVPAAELEEEDESGLVIAETPTVPMNNMASLFTQTAELPSDIRSRLVSGPLQFVSKYIYVEEEWNKASNDDDKVTELLNKYKRDNEIEVGSVADRVAGAPSEDEAYEDATPLHGDRLFHAFLTRLHAQPGQILRYTRDAPPLLGAPLPISENASNSPYKPSICMRCGSRLICELQLVPGFADTLCLFPNHVTLSHLHFLSVLIFTCSQSCWQQNDRLVEEMVILQPEVI